MNSSTKDLPLRINRHLIDHKSDVKYLGVYLNRNLTYELEVKHLLYKMVCDIKTIYIVKDFFSEKTCTFERMVVSHLHYLAKLLNGKSQNLITALKNQLSCGIKTCFNKTNGIPRATWSSNTKSFQSDYFLTTERPLSFGNYRFIFSCFHWVEWIIHSQKINKFKEQTKSFLSLWNCAELYDEKSDCPVEQHTRNYI